MATLSELQTWRDALIRARAMGVKTVEADGERVEYKSDAEMAAALADLDRQIAGMSSTPIRQVRFATSKGI